MQNDLQSNTINYNGLTAKYIKEKAEALKKISDELVEIMTSQMNKDETVNVMRDDWDEKYKKVKEENIG